MNTYLKKLYDGAADASELARSVAQSGLSTVSHVFRGTRIMGALSATVSENAEYDETHYVLVPVLGNGYTVFSKRILPLGIGVTNDLVKKRVFHVPEKSGKEILERELVSQMLEKSMEVSEHSSDLADSLESLAEQIDRETSKVSGGLVLIGGAVAFVNPVLGLGIAAKGLLPSIGAKASKVGAGYVGDKLRNWAKSSEEAKFKKAANKEVKNLKPEIYENPLIQTLEVLSSNPDKGYDPFLGQRNWVGEFECHRYFKVTVEAVAEVYSDAIDSLAKSDRNQTHVAWVQHLIELGVTS